MKSALSVYGVLGFCLFDFDQKFFQNLSETITIFYLDFFFCSAEFSVS